MTELRVLMDRIKAVEREYDATAQAVAGWKRSIQEGKGRLLKPASLRDLKSAVDNLESTYLIRVWAEFETALLSYRRHVTGIADDRMGAKNLVDWTAGVKQGRQISSTVVKDVHKIREYRNHMVHERDDVAPPPAVVIKVARRWLNNFLQALPERW